VPVPSRGRVFPVASSVDGYRFCSCGRCDVEGAGIGTEHVPATLEQGRKILQCQPRENNRCSPRQIPQANTDPGKPAPQKTGDLRPEIGIHLLGVPRGACMDRQARSRARQQFLENPRRPGFGGIGDDDLRGCPLRRDLTPEGGAHHPKDLLRHMHIFRVRTHLPVRTEQVRGFAHTGFIEPVAKRRSGQPGHHSALGVPLDVEGHVVVAFPQDPHRIRRLAADIPRRPLRFPASKIQGDHPAQPRVPLEKSREPAVHHPVHLRLGSGLSQVIDDGEGVRHVAQGGELHHEDPPRSRRSHITRLPP
jgi:hypothetical protein